MEALVNLRWAPGELARASAVSAIRNVWTIRIPRRCPPCI